MGGVYCEFLYLLFTVCCVCVDVLRILHVGAIQGYWAYMLQQAWADVVALTSAKPVQVVCVVWLDPGLTIEL